MQRNCYKLKRMQRHMLYVRNVINYIKPQKFQKTINVNLLSFIKHPMKKYRAECGAELLKNIPVTNGYIKQPHMVFPMPNLKSQVFVMYQHPGFEQNLTKWAHR